MYAARGLSSYFLKSSTRACGLQGVCTKEISFNGEATDFKYLRVLYSIKDILNTSFLNSYELVDLDDKLNLQADSPKSPLYFALKLKRR